MKLTITENSVNYAATVVELTAFRQIEGKDRIQLTTLAGNDVIISKEAQIGQKGIYFVTGTQLSPDYCYNNNLYDEKGQNIDPSQKGYISFKNRRVRAMRMAGIISDGLFMPLASLAYVFLPNWTSGQTKHILEDFKVGDAFTHIDDTLICEKYFIAVRNANPGGTAPKERVFKLQDIMIPNQFRFHHETEHLGKNVYKLNPESEIIITHKLHGSSCIISKVKTLRKLSVIDKVAKFFGAKIVETEYADIGSSGKPKSSLPKFIKSRWTNSGPSFYKDNIWETAYADHKHSLEDGISIYSELVGSHIQGQYDYTKLHGDKTNYGMLVYRITRTNDSGCVDEFSWNQVETYCQKHGLKTVPVLFKGKALHWAAPNDYPFNEDITPEYYINNKFLGELSDKYLEKKDAFCQNDVWAEGICLRIESPYQVYKLKSKHILLEEDKQLDQEQPNVEDQ